MRIFVPFLRIIFTSLSIEWQSKRTFYELEMTFSNEVSSRQEVCEWTRKDENRLRETCWRRQSSPPSGQSDRASLPLPESIRRFCQYNCLYICFPRKTVVLPSIDQGGLVFIALTKNTRLLKLFPFAHVIFACKSVFQNFEFP